MYKLYKEYCTENNMQCEKQSFYRKIFVEEFNLSFHCPSLDTCNTCDKYQILYDSESDITKKETTKQAHNDHLQLAENA